jgi:hypothetical protein
MQKIVLNSGPIIQSLQMINIWMDSILNISNTPKYFIPANSRIILN